MTTVLAGNSYGKSAVRLLRVVRHGTRHEIRDLTVDVALEGAFESAHTSGDNSQVLPTDTMKNTVYALARTEPVGEPEEFAARLAQHFLRASSAATVARVQVREHGWRRIDMAGRPHDHAFERGSAEARVARVAVDRGEPVRVTAGIEELVVLKSARSAFSGYPKGRYTTLPETDDRILSTSVSAHWTYPIGAPAYGVLWSGIRRQLLETFADHDSKSVQHTLYAMGDAVLETFSEVGEIHLVMPNKHHLLVDLSKVGLENENEVFVPTPEPFGLIEATLRRSSGG